MSSPFFIGPRRSGGWKDQFAYPDEFGTGGAAFAHGPGTMFPLPSMPLAQIWRYWWTAKTWNVSWYLENDGPPAATFASGDIPYGCGFDGTNLTARWFCAGGRRGDVFTAPTLAERMIGFSAGPALDDGFLDDGLTAVGGILGVFGTAAESQNYLYIALMGAMGTSIKGNPFPQLEPPDILANWGIVPDLSTPGNYFMSVGIDYQNQMFSANPANAWGPGSTMTATLDGMAIPLYGGGPSWTGNITITTKDS